MAAEDTNKRDKRSNVYSVSITSTKRESIMIIETKIQRNYGTDHEYIVQPPGLAKLWTDITGRKTVTDADLANIQALALEFGDGLAITRNN